MNREGRAGREPALLFWYTTSQTTVLLSSCVLTHSSAELLWRQTHLHAEHLRRTRHNKSLSVQRASPGVDHSIAWRSQTHLRLVLTIYSWQLDICRRPWVRRVFVDKSCQQIIASHRFVSRKKKSKNFSIWSKQHLNVDTLTIFTFNYSVYLGSKWHSYICLYIYFMYFYMYWLLLSPKYIFMQYLYFYLSTSTVTLLKYYPITSKMTGIKTVLKWLSTYLWF